MSLLLSACQAQGNAFNRAIFKQTADEATADQATEPDQQAGSEVVALDGVAQTESNTESLVMSTPQYDEETGMLLQTRALWSWAGRKGETKADIDYLVEQVDQANLNVVFVLLYSIGTIYFEPSHTRFPDPAERLVNQSPFKEEGYTDSLTYLLEIRDARLADDDPTNDFEVHGWFSVNRGGRVSKGWPAPNENDPYMLNEVFPEFKQKLGEYYIEQDDRFVRHHVSVLHQPRFKQYMVDLMAGLAEDYDINGIHLDYIRTAGICFNDDVLDYPGTEFDYPGCQADYEAWTQQTYSQTYSLWDDTDGYKEIRDDESGRVSAWLEATVDDLVTRVHNEVKGVDPDIVITAASVGELPWYRIYSVEGQAAWEWLDDGLIDAAFIMSYKSTTQEVIDKMQLFIDAGQPGNNANRMFPGLATYDFDTLEEWPSLIEEQVDAVLYNDWAGSQLSVPSQGVALFQDRWFSPEAAAMLRAGPFKEPAIPYWPEN